MSKKIKCDIYTRVSTTMQVDGYSLDAQKEKLKRYAEFQNMEIVNEYSDEGKSGKSVEGRPEFQRMLDNIENGTDEVQFVLVFKLSRFGRNAADVRHRHLREADLGQQREERLLYDREGVAPPAVDLGFSHRLSNLSRLTMSSSCSFIDRCTRLFIAPAKINKDTVYRHLFFIAEREHG